MNISDTVKGYEGYYKKVLETGSKVICDPPPEGTDEDYLLLLEDDNAVNTLESILTFDGWVIGGSMAYSGAGSLNKEHSFNSDGALSNNNLFHSWKTPNDEGIVTNLILTCNEQYFEDFTRATFLARRLNLLDKVDRVVLFEALTRDVWPTEKKKEKKTFLNGIIHEGQASWITQAAIYNSNTVVNPIFTGNEW